MLRSAEDDQPFELRLAQAVAWCTPRSKRSLRSEHLRPWVLESDRAWSVRHGVRVDGPARSRADLKGGELLLYFPDMNLADGAAEAETGGFFDVHNTPPWDTWVGLFRDGPTNPSLSDYLVS